MKSIFRGAASIAFVLAVPAAGRGQTQQDPLRQRTGTSAEPQTLPAYARPQPPLTEPLPQGHSALADAGRVRFSDVRVEALGTGSAPVKPGWKPSPGENGPALSVPSHGLDAEWVRQMFIDNGLIGRPVELDRVIALVQAINLAFVANGYINSGLLVAGPPPSDGAPLDLKLVLGRLSGTEPLSIAWTGGRRAGLTTRYVRSRMPSARGVPLDATLIERDFRLLAEDPAIRTVNADLRPGLAPGEAGLVLQIDPAPRADLYMEVANSRSPSIGGIRESLGWTLRSLFSAGDLISAEAGFTSGRPDAAIGYTTPFFSPRTSLTFRVGYNDAAVVDRPLRPLDIKARELSAEFGLSRVVAARPLLPREGGWRAARSLSVGLLASHRRTRTWLLGEPFSFSPGSVNGRAEYSALRLTGDFVERGIRHVAAISVTISQGLEGTRSDVPGVAGPDPHFRSILAQASEAFRLDASGLELRIRLAGQWADGLLYSGERLAAGGAYTVRGYRETLALADSGAIGSIELAQPFSLSGGRRNAGGADWGAFSASLFADGALLHNRQGPQPEPRRLASLGAALAWAPSSAFSARISYGEALTRQPAIGSRDLQDDGFSFRITFRPLFFLKRVR